MIFCTKQLFKSCFAVVFSVQHTVLQGYNVAETVRCRGFLAMRFFGKKGDCNEGFTQIRCKTGLHVRFLGKNRAQQHVLYGVFTYGICSENHAAPMGLF